MLRRITTFSNNFFFAMLFCPGEGPPTRLNAGVAPPRTHLPPQARFARRGKIQSPLARSFDAQFRGAPFGRATANRKRFAAIQLRANDIICALNIIWASLFATNAIAACAAHLFFNA